MKQGRVLLLGDLNIDSFWPVPEFPIPGRDGLVEEVKFEVGGGVLNTAVILDRLGIRTSVISCMGSDRWRDFILEALAGSGIDLESVQVISTAMTGINFTIVTPDGERTMFTHRGANAKLDPTQLAEDCFRDAALLHISGYALLESPQRDAVRKAVELAKKHDVAISLDTGLEPVMKKTEDFRALAKELTICITGAEEVNHLFEVGSMEDAVQLLQGEGTDLVAIKLGSKGSLVFNPEKQFSCPCFDVDAVDTTGAGDSFSAGIIYGWLHGFGLEETTVLASALGGLATTVYGAGMSLPKRGKIVEFLEEQRMQNLDVLNDGIKYLIEHFRSN